MEAIWADYTRPERWALWSPHLRAADTPFSPIRTGSVGRVHGVGGVRADFRVDDVDDHARTWGWTVTLGPLTVHLVHGVDDPSDGGTTAWVRIHGPLLVVAGYAPLMHWALHRLVTRNTTDGEIA